MNVLSLCSGIGGLDLGIRLAIPEARTVCFVEREAYCAALLVARMQDGALDEAPVWSDLATFDGREWRGVVDCVVAGYPCQPFSRAGKRTGASDPRHLWPHVARIIRECGPRVVVLENVVGHLSLGFHEVCEELRDMGLVPAAGLFSASEVGACHERLRLFVLALAPDTHVVRPQGVWEASDRAWTEQQLEGLVQDSLRDAVPADSRSGMDDGAPWRAHRLQALGNGVVPLAAANALCSLADAFGVNE